MSTCQHCGIGNSPIRSLCTTCGKDLPKPVAGTDADLSALWRIRFDLIEKAGGPTRPLFKQLTFGQRCRVAFNLWALVFGLFYYLAKGMWRKAITVLCLSLSVLALSSFLPPDGGLSFIPSTLNIMITFWYFLNANINYYKKVVLGDNGWW
ncbi:DUF2628 domain-containing protein [Oxalobacteraceae bacterium OTU3CINTB1]|nr:DUF2628 domain-containing protein [Oxalobacteraceae bacterium OTU3CINTB1]